MSLPIISVAQMREWENASWASGQTEAEVIRRVGKAVASRALQLTRDGESILLLAGRGHNGDDIRAAQERLHQRRVELLNVTEPKAALGKFAERISARGNTRPTALIVDGLFGIGLNRPLDEDWKQFIAAVNETKIPILAVDVPSGLNADTGEHFGEAIRATVTLTVGAPKRGMLSAAAWEFVGRLEVAADVGLIDVGQAFQPAGSGDFPIARLGTESSKNRQTGMSALQLHWTLPEDFQGFPPARSVASHKGSFGHLAIIAGSFGFHGAAVLAAHAAQRARPGLITVLPQQRVYFPVAAQLQSPMVHPWSAELPLPEKCSALLVGPGLASPDLPEELKSSTRRLWRDFFGPMVVDASALDWLEETPAIKLIRVITPHPGEAARLLKSTVKQIQDDRLGAVRALSQLYGNCWVILKGHQTLVGASTGEVFVNPSGNAGLAQGGSGDALAGFLAGLLAQPGLQADVLKTIRYAVWQHGAVADALETRKANWTVEDLVEQLGAVC